ncbi:efflux RND transporter permease subunit [Hymenobacter sp. BT664]|uniref:Efflux RND transporter permease subunit n=1 Tax=Hymenobacter montanus TaxID=2771359 RepID=A0A927GJ57_9BACT|nr:efflux RND transporter permease subunit [Hymenobacter montanus]MBD2768143.1 efflux RND transporter permease subunit [Hymenobacter montanus]
MRIVAFSVKNYQFMLVVFLLALGLGLNALLTMPRAEDPSTNAPSFTVVAVYPGTNPTDMEDLVVKPLEEKLNELDNVKKLVTTIDDGLAVVRIDFVYAEDPDDKYAEVLREVNNLRPELPADLASLEVQKFTPSDVNILQVALIAPTLPYAELQKQAEELQDRLQKVKVLKKVETWGYPQRQVRVSLNLEKMARLNLGLARVLGALQSENVNIPGGSVEAGAKKFNIKTSGRYANLAEIQNTVVQATAQSVVYLKDVADVSFNYEEENYLGRLNGQRAVFVTAALKDKQNIIAARKQLTPILEQFTKELPAGIRYVKSFDQADNVAHRLDGFSRDFAIAIGLVLLTLLPLGWRASVVVMISIPLCLAIGLALMNLLGFSINQLSIVGLVVALGLLVDDSIVVVENIERYLREGYGRVEAAIKATEQIALAVVGCTAVLILAFLPLVFLPEGAGDFIRSLPIAVITTVLASLFVALTIVPFLASRILSKHEQAEGNFFLRGLNRLLNRTYKPLLDAALHRPYLALAVAGAIFVGALALIPKVGFSVFPRSEKPMFLVNVETPLGTSLYETDRITRLVEAELGRHPEVRNYATNVGRSNPSIYYNVVPHNNAANFAEVFVQTQPLPVKELEAFITKLRGRLTGMPGAKVEVKQFEQGPPVEAPIAIRVFGDNLDSLRSLAFRVETLLARNEGTIYVNNPLTSLGTDLKVTINKDKAGLLGIPTAEIDRTVRLGVAGLNVGTFQLDGDDNDYNINVTLPRGPRQTLEVFDRLYVSSASGALVPLRQLADIRLEASPTTVRHYDKDRFVTITAFVKPGFLTNNVYAQVLKQLDTLRFPAGYRYVAAGEKESAEDSFGGLGTIIIITVFGILAVLILEFRTFKSTLIVLSVIPLGVIGAVLALLLTGNSFSFVAVIGLIALIGIEVKNSILLVDFTNQLRGQGRSLEEAIEEAGQVRFIPILLTTLTAIGGLVPLVLENNPLYSPLAWVLIGGLISSLLLTRIVTPVLYKLLPPTLPQPHETEVAEAPTELVPT